jgi:hypothetical protein
MSHKPSYKIHNDPISTTVYISEYLIILHSCHIVMVSHEKKYSAFKTPIFTPFLLFFIHIFLSIIYQHGKISIKMFDNDIFDQILNLKILVNS